MSSNIRELPANYKGVPGLALHFGIEKGQFFTDGKGQITYQKKEPTNTLVQVQGGIVKITDPSQLALSNVGGLIPFWNTNSYTPSVGLVSDERLNMAGQDPLANSFVTVLTGGTTAATLSVDATVLKPQGGASNKLTITNGGANISAVKIKSAVDMDNWEADEYYCISVCFKTDVGLTKNINLYLGDDETGAAYSEVSSITVTDQWVNYGIRVMATGDMTQNANIFIKAGGNTRSLWFSDIDIRHAVFPHPPQGVVATNPTDLCYLTDNYKQLRWDEGTLLIRGYVPWWHIIGDPVVPYICGMYLNDTNLIMFGMSSNIMLGAIVYNGAILSATSFGTLGQSNVSKARIYNMAFSWKNGRQIVAYDFNTNTNIAPTTATSASDLSAIGTSTYNDGSKLCYGSGDNVHAAHGLLLSGKDNGVFYFNRALSLEEVKFITKRDNLY